MQQPTRIDLDSKTLVTKHAAERSTLVSVDANLTLTAMQPVAGVFAYSQALIVDAIHSLSDLVSDFVVLFTGHHSQEGPDVEHHCGHFRSGTAASLASGLLLLIVGVGILWGAVTKLEHPESISHVKLIGLWVVLNALVNRELLFRHMLAVAERVRSNMLVANA